MSKQSTQIAVGLFTAAWAVAWLVFIMSQAEHGVVVYDCRLAEISPDFPVSVKEQCRKANSGRL